MPAKAFIPVTWASIIRPHSKPITNLNNQWVPRFIINKVIGHGLGTKLLINLKRQLHTPLIHSFPAKLYSPTARCSEIILPNEPLNGEGSAPNNNHPQVRIIARYEFLKVHISSFVGLLLGKICGVQQAPNAFQHIKERSLLLPKLSEPLLQRRKAIILRKAPPESFADQLSCLAFGANQAHVCRTCTALELEDLGIDCSLGPRKRFLLVVEHIARYQRRSDGFQQILLSNLVVKVPASFEIREHLNSGVLQREQDLLGCYYVFIHCVMVVPHESIAIA